MWKSILYKELLSESRSLYQLSGLLSFLLAVSYLVYFFSGELSDRSWNLLYWIIYLFLSFFAANRSYEDDNTHYKIYCHQLYPPLLLFFAKAFYLFLVLFVFASLLYFIFYLLLPPNISMQANWFVIIALSSFGFAVLTAFTSFIASHAQGNQVLLVIVSLPLCFPLIGMSYSLCLDVLQGEMFSEMISKCYPLLAIDLIAMALVVFILPLSWQN